MTSSSQAVAGNFVARLPYPLRAPLEWRRAWLEMDRNPRAIAFAQTGLGVALLHIGFFALLWLAHLEKLTAFYAMATLLACALFPARRMAVVGTAGLLFIFLRPFRAEGAWPTVFGLLRDAGATQLAVTNGVMVGCFLLLGWAALAMQARHPKHYLSRHALTIQSGLFLALVGAACWLALPPLANALLWAFICIFASGFWTFAYASLNVRSKTARSPAENLGFLRPFWGGEMGALGKGASFLDKFNAKDAETLAVTRLKALKLILWAVLLRKLEVVLNVQLDTNLGVPTLRDAIEAQAHQGVAHSPLLGWAILLRHYFVGVIKLAAIGHVYVALARMAGFGIPRNTARPLSARSLGEFWNRYFYYFKEILVDFYFMPAFLRFFKKSLRMRTAFATLCSASFANIFFHFIYEIHYIPEEGLLKMLEGFLPFTIYTLLLAGGIIVSQWRNKHPKPEDGFWRYDVLPRVNVTLFFCLISVFNDYDYGITVKDCAIFGLSLFGIGA